MERDHVGSFLRKQREARGISLAQLSRATKIKEASLAALEDARFNELPARVFVVGWVGAYARAVGADAEEAVSLLQQCRPASGVHVLGECMPKVVAKAPDEAEAPARGVERRRFGVVLVVFLLLIVATLTLSLLLHHGGRFGGGMS